jgi:hypothetical protein
VKRLKFGHLTRDSHNALSDILKTILVEDLLVANSGAETHWLDAFSVVLRHA